MDFHRRQVDSQMGALAPAEEGRQRYSREAEHFVRWCREVQEELAGKMRKVELASRLAQCGMT